MKGASREMGGCNTAYSPRLCASAELCASARNKVTNRDCPCFLKRLPQIMESHQAHGAPRRWKRNSLQLCAKPSAPSFQRWRNRAIIRKATAQQSPSPLRLANKFASLTASPLKGRGHDRHRQRGEDRLLWFRAEAQSFAETQRISRVVTRPARSASHPSMDSAIP